MNWLLPQCKTVTKVLECKVRKYSFHRNPTWTGKWENVFQSGKNREILNWKSERFLVSFYFYFFLWLFNWSVFVRFFVFVKFIKWKWKENTGKVGAICQSKNVGTMRVLLWGLKVMYILVATENQSGKKLSAPQIGYDINYIFSPIM